MEHLPRLVRDAKAEDLASCWAGALFIQETTLVYTLLYIQALMNFFKAVQTLPQFLPQRLKNVNLVSKQCMV